MPKQQKVSKNAHRPDQRLASRKQLEAERRREHKESIAKIKAVNPLTANCESLDNNSILRISRAFIVNQNKFGDTSIDPLPKGTITALKDIMEDENNKIIVCSGESDICFCTNSAFREFGYRPSDVVGAKLTNLVYENDKADVEDELRKIADSLIASSNTNRCSFNIFFRINKKKTSNNNAAKWPTQVQFRGLIDVKRNKLSCSQTWEVKRAENGHMSFHVKPKENSTSSINYADGITFRGTIQAVDDTSINSQICFILANKNEYRLLMTLNGDIVDADHRILHCIGYHPEDVKFKSAYDYIAEDDCPLSYFAHSQMFNNAEGVGNIVHRLKLADKRLVYFFVVGKILYGSSHQKGSADYQTLFVATATPLSDKEGEEKKREFEASFSPTVLGKKPTELRNALMASVSGVRGSKSAQKSITECPDGYLSSRSPGNKDSDYSCSRSDSTSKSPVLALPLGVSTVSNSPPLLTIDEHTDSGISSVSSVSENSATQNNHTNTIYQPIESLFINNQTFQFHDVNQCCTDATNQPFVQVPLSPYRITSITMPFPVNYVPNINPANVQCVSECSQISIPKQVEYSSTISSLNIQNNGQNGAVYNLTVANGEQSWPINDFISNMDEDFF